MFSDDWVEQPKPERVYPILNTMVKLPGLGQPWYYVTDCCFHDLFEAHEGELAGMGLAIIGNLMKRIGNGTLTQRHEVRLELILAQGAEPIRCPWPGMPDDSNIVLDYSELPWDSTMFLSADNKFKYRIDRLKMMHRIQNIWTAWLITQLLKFPGAWRPSIEKVEI